MKALRDYTAWTFHHTWVLSASYLISLIAILMIHGSFGFTMADDGSYLSNSLMHLGGGIVLALGTGILQRELLRKHIRLSFSWTLMLITGFVLAEIVAGIVLWKLEIFRGMINIINTDVHYPEALIFSFAGLIAGVLQVRLLKSYRSKWFYWILASTVGWALFVLSTYLSPFALPLGALLYGAVTGLVLRN